MKEKIYKETAKLFEDTFNDHVLRIEKLPISGSARTYYRVTGNKYSVIATYNEDVKENSAFITLGKHFKEKGHHVPEIYSVNKARTLYLQEDLGNETLFDRTKKLRNNNAFPKELTDLYKKATEQLAELQINGSKGIDYSVCYPRKSFDKQSILWDLNYFKYNFLKLTGIHFSEQLLEDDFKTLIELLLKADLKFFLYRDFKSLNIMIHEETLYFIDYQGGRKGALHYDIASLLHEANANLPPYIKNELLEHYIEYAGKLTNINKKEFIELYHAYSLIRILQAMGTYGFRGLYEKKQHYIDSIPARLKSLKSLLKDMAFLDDMPELKGILEKLTQTDLFKPFVPKEKLCVSVKSFSYKSGIPTDFSSHGGGFVFDCRFINNPGRLKEYTSLNGKDKEIIEFLEADKTVQDFFNTLEKIIDTAVRVYISRGFKYLSINFGCTGGQHRSVFFAEKVKNYLQKNYDVYVELEHTQGF